MSIIEVLSRVLEPFYYIASIGLLASVIIGIRQLKMLKSDILIRTQRASLEKSLEYLDWFASEFLPTLANYRKRLNEIHKLLKSKSKESNNPFYEDLKEDITVEHIDIQDKFQKNKNELNDQMISIVIMIQSGADDILNQLEYFAAAMTCGLANEELAFNPLSEAYCDTVEEFYYAICYLRGPNPKLYSNVVKLYKIWKPRIHKEELQDKHKQLSEKLSQIPDTKIDTIGL